MYMHTDQPDDRLLRRRFVIEGFVSGMHLRSRDALHPSDHVNGLPGGDDSGPGGASLGRTRISASTGGDKIDKRQRFRGSKFREDASLRFNWRGQEDKRKSEDHTLVKPGDAISSSDVVTFGLDIFEILANFRGAYSKSQEVSSQTRNHQLPSVQPDFLNKDEWDLLVGMCAADPAQRTNLGMDEIVYRLEKLSERGNSMQMLTIAAPKQGSEPVVDIKQYVQRCTIAELLRNVEILIDEAPDAAAVNRLVYNRLADIFEQLVAVEQFPPLALAEAFSNLLWGYYDQLDEQMDDFSIPSAETAYRNYGVHYDIDRLILSTPLLHRTASIHNWKLSWKQAPKQTWLDSPSLLTEQKQLATTSGVAEQRGIDPEEWLIPIVQVELGSCIARGSFSSVYRGKWLGVDVAIKQILIDQSDEESRAQFRHEADLWFPLDHSHIIKLYGTCTEVQPFFVCELASQGTLVHFLKGKQCSERWRALYSAALGLQYLHKRGVVHADLKGDSILVCEDGTVKLSDFGLGVFANRAWPSAGSETGALGAIRWKAPECLNGAAPTFASNVYSFGMCIIEAVTGEFPWGNSIPDRGVKYYVKQGTLPERPEAFSDAEWELVTLMCAFDPQKRITVDTIVDLLSNFDPESKVIVEADEVFARVLRAPHVGDKSPRKSTPVLVYSSMFTCSLLHRGVGDNASRLCKAAAVGDIEKVKALVDAGVDKAAMTMDGNTALALAAEYGHLAVVQYLVDAGADKEARDTGGYSALSLAAIYGHLDVVRCLVDAGTNKDAKDAGCKTALRSAAEYGHVDVVRYLIDVGADLEAKDPGGKTAMSLAAKYDHLDVVRYLVDAGADKEAKDTEGYTALSLAAQYGHLDVVRYLVDAGVDKNAEDRKGNSVVCLAARNDQPDVVRYLIDAGADKGAKNGGGKAALIWAAGEGRLDVVRCLVDAIAKKETPEDRTRRWASHRRVKSMVVDSALSSAGRAGHLNVVQYLVNAGADINAKDADGYTALSLAASEGHLDVVRYLVGASAKKSISSAQVPRERTPKDRTTRRWASRKKVRNTDVDTALSSAGRAGHLNVVRYLIDAGADIKAKDTGGKTALISAAEYGHLDVVRYLIDASAKKERTTGLSASRKEVRNTDVDTALNLAGRAGHFDVVRYLVDAGVDKEAKDAGGKTVMSLAARYGHLDVVRYLVDAGANKEAKDTDGYTALSLAAKYGHLDVVRYLVDAGVYKEAKDVDSMTALSSAGRAGHVDVVRYLVDAGVDKEAKDGGGKTALIWAAMYGHLDVVQYLVDAGANKEVKDAGGKTALTWADIDRHLDVVRYLADHGAALRGMTTSVDTSSSST